MDISKKMKRVASGDLIIAKSGFARVARRPQIYKPRFIGPIRPGDVRARGIPANLYPGSRTGATELKSTDQALTVSPIMTAGTISLVVAPPLEGASFYQRIGRRIRMKSLEIRGEITPNNTNAAAVPQQFARIMVLYDRQTNGALPALADILTGFNAAGATTSTVWDGLNMNNRDRFTVLRDRKLILNGLGINGATPANITGLSPDPNVDNTSYVFREFIKLKGLETHFKASAGGVGDIATGSIVLLTVSSADANAAPAWQLAYGARLKFYD